MNIYLKWTSDQLPDKYTLSLFDLDISQQENCFAKACLIIDALAPLPQAGTEGIIIQENQEILFKGLLVGHPVKIEGAFAEIELIANPLDFLDKASALQKENRVPPYWDGLWIRPDKHNNFQEIQGVRTGALFCDPRTGELSLSDWFEGRKTLPLYQNFFPSSLQLQLLKQPLQSCTVHVHAHWVQWNRGISNIGPQIRKVFSLSKGEYLHGKGSFRKMA